MRALPPRGVVWPMGQRALSHIQFCRPVVQLTVLASNKRNHRTHTPRMIPTNDPGEGNYSVSVTLIEYLQLTPERK